MLGRKQVDGLRIVGELMRVPSSSCSNTRKIHSLSPEQRRVRRGISGWLEGKGYEFYKFHYNCKYCEVPALLESFQLSFEVVNRLG